MYFFFIYTFFFPMSMSLRGLNRHGSYAWYRANCSSDNWN
ncbi:L2 pX 5.2 kDa protein [Human adenovirus 55]|uniref:L2 pX 5.2 kDa protein n=1 Tax=Human adenovirus 55 TaxID=714978 RepID=A0A075FDF6_9ADEN|nr:protein V precursor [Human adenovirus 55]AIE89161.1 hypothetical protein [Human adenovirus 55]AMB61226.1 protein V precursor [Human adenovirus 55]QOL08507.1 L2 pX 5.2 kDa protein [Human adenovirus 55]QOL08540.1 L2 pX 5.2 kDa protein [Human adenovirus 55]